MKAYRVPLLSFSPYLDAIQADVARMLRARDEDHAADICRALSLPIDEAEGGREGDRVVRSVVFKSVPAVWTSEKAAAEGYSCGDGGGDGDGDGDASAPRQQPECLELKLKLKLKSSLARSAGSDAKTNVALRNKRDSIASAREDGLVGLTRALAVTLTKAKAKAKKEETPATVTCGACAGFGCSWCDNGVVKVEAEEEVVGGDEEEGLWGAALCPT